MGHLYRALNLAETLRRSGMLCKFYVNSHSPSLEILQSKNVDYEVVPLLDPAAIEWEKTVIRRDQVEVWINDRLDTDVDHCKRVKSCGIPLVTFDDRGLGATMADLHIAALAFDNEEVLAGHQVLRGVDYLVLNPEIRTYRRLRNTSDNILITMGGADTYGVTIKVIRALVALGMKADVIIGPCFEHGEELNAIANDNFTIKQAVPSLIAEFEKYDLAITGGGITPFEANASGLPCIVVANELFEIPVGKALENYGGAIFAGYHEHIDTNVFSQELSVGDMSHAGLSKFNLDGARRIVESIKEL
ncbi:MAG: hypothetical protein QTN59_12915 [Candidatus Electrothrix communis]|nr:MAG: hypothetical protein QTN59_12915 [Candidatus Electrothrix communis]